MKRKLDGSNGSSRRLHKKSSGGVSGDMYKFLLQDMHPKDPNQLCSPIEGQLVEAELREIQRLKKKNRNA